MNDIVRSKITNKTIYNINKTNFDDAMTEFIINKSNIQFPPPQVLFIVVENYMFPKQKCII